jgi:hypothetical protein
MHRALRDEDPAGTAHRDGNNGAHLQSQISSLSLNNTFQELRSKPDSEIVDCCPAFRH